MQQTLIKRYSRADFARAKVAEDLLRSLLRQQGRGARQGRLAIADAVLRNAHRTRTPARLGRRRVPTLRLVELSPQHRPLAHAAHATARLQLAKDVMRTLLRELASGTPAGRAAMADAVTRFALGSMADLAGGRL